MNETRTSILDMAMGAIKERADYEMAHIIDNILDPNTDPKRNANWSSHWKWSLTANARLSA